MQRRARASAGVIAGRCAISATWAARRTSSSLPVTGRPSANVNARPQAAGTGARCFLAKASVSARSASRSSLVAARVVFTSATTIPR
jgi:type II secretory pathway pseudopilin PulG